MFINLSRAPLCLAMWVFLALLAVGAATSRAESDAAQIEGAWMGTLTTTAPPLGPFTHLITLIPNGGVVSSIRLYLPETPFGPILGTAGHGEWKEVGQREFQINFVSLVQGAPDNANAKGVELGTDNLSLRVTLNRDGTELNGFFQDAVIDLEGNVVFAGEGTYHATRIRAAP
jgi:hypothetical protein